MPAELTLLRPVGRTLVRDYIRRVGFGRKRTEVRSTAKQVVL